MNRFTHCFEKIKKDYFSFCKKEEIKGEKSHNKKKRQTISYSFS